jgi:hypothetical protein
VEAFADAVGLRALGLGAGIVDVLHRQVEFVLVMLGPAAIFRAGSGTMRMWDKTDSAVKGTFKADRLSLVRQTGMQGTVQFFELKKVSDKGFAGTFRNEGFCSRQRDDHDSSVIAQGCGRKLAAGDPGSKRRSGAIGKVVATRRAVPAADRGSTLAPEGGAAA